MKKRVVIGLSGGVDSSVAAHLLKQEGYEVIAVFMINWHDKTGVLKGDCPWDEDVTFAELVARKLDMPFHVVDLSDNYRERVVNYMFDEYSRGRTPNPDVLCNREIKFDAFFEALEPFNADYIATGHYCQKGEQNIGKDTFFQLLAGADKGKDQSYFLCQLNQEQLSKTLFPIGHLQKSEVRQIARDLKLASAEKKDSQGICFVGKVDLPTFLQQKLVAKAGDVIEIPPDSQIYKSFREDDDLIGLTKAWEYSRGQGFVTGQHQGAHFYTIGQRKGLNIGGKKEPLFVIAIDVKENIVYVGQGQNHPGLYRPALFVKKDEIHWIRPDKELEIGANYPCKVRIRYRQPLQDAVIIRIEEGIVIRFDQDQRGIAAGQFAAWYDDNELIGSGVISE
jgi:tRNA-specific 2-thiouridylase